MRVSIFGKGGSGKTTLTTEFVKYLQKTQKDREIVAIDADINVHLGKALDMKERYLGDIPDQLYSYFESERGNPLPRTSERGKRYYNYMKKNQGGIYFIGHTPPSLTTKFIKPNLKDPFFNYFTSKKGNTALITIGSYNDQGVGYECYHGKLGSLELILNRLLDNKNMFVVIDSTAGVDSVGTSLFFAGDINVFVVEPTLKGISVFKDFEKITHNYKLNNYVVVNKITSQADIDFIEKYIPKDRIVGYMKNSDTLKKFEQGDKDSFEKFVDDNEELNKRLVEIMENTPKDWDKYYTYLVKCYVDNCLDWYNKQADEDLTNYIDPDFSYKEVIEEDV